MPFGEIADKVAETVAAGGTGILLQGGVHPDLRIDDYEDCSRFTAFAARDIKLGVLTALIGAPFFIWLVLKTRREMF